MTRLCITFWTPVVLVIAATGGLTRALGAPAGPAAAGLTVAIAGFGAAVTDGLALRIAVVVNRPVRAGSAGGPGAVPAASQPGDTTTRPSVR